MDGAVPHMMMIRMMIMMIAMIMMILILKSCCVFVGPIKNDRNGFFSASFHPNEEEGWMDVVVCLLLF
jgi:hypothetical protein